MSEPAPPATPAPEATEPAATSGAARGGIGPAPKRHWAARIFHSGLFKIALAAGLMSWLYASGRLDLAQVAGALKSWPWVIAAAVAMLPSFLISSFRYYVVLHGLDLPCTYRRALVWTMIGEFWNVAMPGTGGDLMKAVYVVQNYGPGRRGVAALSVLMDRAIGLSGLLFFALGAYLVGWGTVSGNARFVPVFYFLAISCTGMLIGLWVLGSTRVENSTLRKKVMGWLPRADKFEKIYLGFAGLVRRPGRVVAIILLSMLNHAAWCAGLICLTHAMGLQVNLAAEIIILPLGLLFNVFGFAGGFGGGTVAFDYLFENFLELAKGDGAALATTFHILALALRFGVGLPFYLIGGRKTGEVATVPASSEPEAS